MRGSLLILIATAILTSCASQGNPDMDASGYPLASRDFATASKRNPGTDKDLEAIKQAIIQGDPQKALTGADITDIRWISATRAMACIERNYTDSRGHKVFYYTLGKTSQGWQILFREDMTS